MPENREEVPVVRQVRSFDWSNEDAVAYEAALEAINKAVGAYTALLAAEEAKPDPAPDVIASARAHRADCARWREVLDPSDRAAVAETRQRFAQLANEVRAYREQ